MLRIFIILNILFVDLFSYISIEFSPIEYFIPNYRIKFQATMKEYYHNLDSAKLKFRTSATDSKFYYVEMQCSLDNTCEAIIPAPMKSTKSIQYFIEAKDRIGDIYKTQQFSVSQIQLPIWQIDTTAPIKMESDGLIIENVSLNGFSDKVQVQYKTDTVKRVKSKIHLPQNVLMGQKKAEIEVNLTGIWSIHRTLSTCSSNLYSHKVIKIKSSSDNKIIESKHMNNGTKLRYIENKGYVCQLIEDNSDGALIGSDSVYTRETFFKSLKSSMSDSEAVKLLEFSNTKIVFELHFQNTTLTTIYKREKALSFVR